MRLTSPGKLLAALAVLFGVILALAAPAGAVTSIEGHFTSGTFTLPLGTDLTLEIGATPEGNPCTDDPYPAPEVHMDVQDVFPYETQITFVDFAPVYVQYPAGTGDWWRVDLSLGDDFDNQGFISQFTYTYQDLALWADVTDLGPDPDPEDCAEGDLACTYYAFFGGLLGDWYSLPPSQGDDGLDYDGQGFAFTRPEHVEECRPGMVREIPDVAPMTVTDLDFTSLP